ncbi:MAG TPA: KH domain-containing protein [Acidimicrobiia bacterium]
MSDDALEDDFDDDEVAGEGNRAVGVHAKAVVEHVTRAIADEPDAVEVELVERRDEVALLVHADPSDMGRLIGKRGRVIQALRQVTRAAGAAEGIKVSVDVIE